MEDGPIEYATSIAYFLSSLFSISLAIVFFRKKKNLFAIVYLLLSVPFFVISMEEISWGQRIFLIENTGFFEDNLQNETNFHNLPIFNEYLKFYFLLISAGGFTLWIFFTHFEKLKGKSFAKFFVPPKISIPYFISVFLYYEIQIFEQYLPRSSDNLLLYIFRRDNENFEFLLSMGILICIISIVIKLRNHNRILNFKEDLHD